MTVNCPIGTAAVGCGIKPLTNSKVDPLRYVYPISPNGTGCECGDDYGAMCEAICISNVYDYEIVILNAGQGISVHEMILFAVNELH